MRQSLTLGLALVLSATLEAGNWPAYRGPKGNGLAESDRAPVEWDETTNIRWKTPIHGKAWSSPVLWGGQVWMTSATENGKELFAVCVDRDTGKLIHDIKVFDVEKPAFCHQFNSYASCTPVIEEGRVYVHFGSAGTACLDTTTGKVLWGRRDLPCDHFRGPGSSPILCGKHLILTFDGFDHQYVAALDKETGKTVWKRDRDIRYSTSDGDYKKAYSTPAIMTVSGQLQIVSPSAEATIAYDPTTGEELWRVIHGGMNAAARPVFGNGLLYLTSGHTAHLLALRVGGRGDVTDKALEWKATRGVPTRSSLLLVGDLLFMVNDGGIASCLDARTGKTHWQERLGGAYSASPVYCGGNVYFADEEGKTHVVKAEPVFQRVATNRLDSGCMASAAVVDGAIFLRTKTHLYRIEAPASSKANLDNKQSK